MFKFNFLFIVFIINYLSTNQKLCGRKEIEHCQNCDYEKEICTKCDDTYFPLFAGLKCISCTDEQYGQKACLGNCDGSKYNEIETVLCDKCKEGYYSIKGICFNCTDGSENCVKCSYEASSESDMYIYTCLECVDGLNGEYRVSKIDGKCRTCNKPDCLECQFVKGKLDDYICTKCPNEYYLSNGRCIECDYISNTSPGGTCYNYYCPGGNHNRNNYCHCYHGFVETTLNTCTPCPSHCLSCYYDPNTNLGKCSYCEMFYTLTDQGECFQCPNNCIQCSYDKNTNTAICDECAAGFAKTTQNTCTSCPTNCISCNYDPNTNLGKCSVCERYYTITDQGECIQCPSNCNYCSYDKNTNSAICNECYNRYVLKPNKECASCGEGCSSCKFENEQVICISCDNRYTLDETDFKCKHCPNYCSHCLFNDSHKLICDNCDLDYVLNEAKLCEFCTSNEEIGGVGCLHCKYENGINKCTYCRDDYIHIDNDFVCKLPSEVNLSISCRNALRLENGEYSCIKCRNISYTLMIRYNRTNDCYPAEKELVNCEKGYEDEYRNLSCTDCLYKYRFIWSEEYQKDICDNQCASDYFFNYDEDIRGCYKCDDESGGGQIGCNPKKGCSYIAADDHIYCNSCKTGYFRYDWQCLNCSKRDCNCMECDYNKTEDKFKCNKCISNIFYINETDLCDTITYDEYPEVTAGCILPINNYTLYLKNKTCFDCKYGFFKTKEESCIYCKARKNGGPKCDECQYIVGNNGIDPNRINCKICQNDNMLSPIGKRCYNCVDEVGPGCKECEFEEGTERVICKACKEDYYLNSKKYCTYKENGDKSAPNCLIFVDNNSNSKRLLAGINVKCIKCNDGYFLNNRDICEALSLDKCSFQFMFNYKKSIFDECINYCQIMNYAFVNYKENSEKIEKILRKNITFSNDEAEIEDIIENGLLCINNIDENNGLRKCINIEYDSNTKNFKCLECINGYQLDNTNNICKQITEIENKNIIKQECNSETIFIKAERGTFCEKPIGELEGCANGTTAITQYEKTIYNCYNCSDNYEPIFLSYFNRKMCIGAKFPIMENTKFIPPDAYKGIDKDTELIDGKCSDPNLFTPDHENCYYCKNDKVGMPGCDGSCTYSLDRINVLECEEGKCKSGYLETSKGLCESCDIVNKGCENCIYNEAYPDGYSGFMRQRRFECKKCDEGYQLAKDGICHHCSEFGFTYCDKCIKNLEYNEYECIQCIDGYFLANNGYCTKCVAPKVQGTENRCIFCNNTEEGGIRGCELCFSDNGNITCQQCKKGFILSEDDQTCLEISENQDVESFTNCQKVLR